MTQRRVSVCWRVMLVVMLSVLAACERQESGTRANEPELSAQATAESALSSSAAASTRSRSAVPARRSYADAIPAGLQLSGPPDFRAAQLAEKVAAGGAQALPALITALSHSGIAVGERGEEELVEAAQPIQGLTFRAWEVNALGDLLARGRQPLQPLSSVADVIASSIDGIDRERVAKLLLEDLRAHAQGAHGPQRFWARFIVELGRRSRFAPHDMLSENDIDAIELDGIQLALISQRLAADVLHKAGAGAQQAAAGDESTAWLLDLLVQRANAQSSPCTFEGPDGEVLDWHAIATGYGFGQLLGYLEGAGMAAAGRLATLTSIGNALFAYAKLIYMHAAFEVEFELEGGQPLVRTQKQNPQSGEVRTLVATVTMNSKDDQWVNCLRPVLNAMGLDFNTEADGAMKGVSVTWSGRAGFDQRMAANGGPDYVVRYVTDDSQRIQSGGGVGPGHAIMDNRTDDQGKARVNVEGVGQSEDLGPDPEPVMKAAMAVAKVVLKPADLYRDLKDATGTASSGLGGLIAMPAELLYRTRWSFGATYLFEVKDWHMRAPAWTGTITYSREETKKTEQVRDSHCCGGKPTRSTSKHEWQRVSNQTWTIDASQQPTYANERAFQTPADYSMHFGGLEISDNHRTGYNSCGRQGGSPTTFTKTHEEKTHNTAFSGTASVNVNVDSRDGAYYIEVAGPEQDMEGDYTWLQVTEFGPGCGGDQRAPVRRTAAKAYEQGHWSPQIRGQLDPSNPNELSGAQAETNERKDGTVISEHVTWELRRR